MANADSNVKKKKSCYQIFSSYVSRDTVGGDPFRLAYNVSLSALPTSVRVYGFIFVFSLFSVWFRCAEVTYMTAECIICNLVVLWISGGYRTAARSIDVSRR